MDPIAVGSLVFVCTFGGALGGIWLRKLLPERHLTEDSKATVRVSIGLIATMTALVLGLVAAEAKSSFDSVTATVRNAAADVVVLDRVLARYGPESQAAREALYHVVAVRLDMTWPQDSSRPTELVTLDVIHGAERVVSAISDLAPQNDDQRWLQSRALTLGERLLEERWELGTVGASGLRPFLVALLFWLTITFGSFGLFAPSNATVVVALLVAALSVAGVVFLILEMDAPFDGMIKVSAEPLRYALSWLRQ